MIDRLLAAEMTEAKIRKIRLVIKRDQSRNMQGIGTQSQR
jgi:hypothetical protein